MESGVKQGIIAGGSALVVGHITGIGGLTWILFAAGAAHLAAKTSSNIKQGAIALAMVCAFGFGGGFLGLLSSAPPTTMQRVTLGGMVAAYAAVGGAIGLGIYYIRFKR